MINRLLKKITVAIACIGMLVNSSSPVFAAQMLEEETNSVSESTKTDLTVSLLGNNSFTLELPHNSALNGCIEYMGYNPTVRVTARGNSNMTFKVSVVNPAGVTGTVGYVRGNGETIEKNLFLSVAGDYHVYVQPWEGTTNGQSAYFDFNVTW